MFTRLQLLGPTTLSIPQACSCFAMWPVLTAFISAAARADSSHIHYDIHGAIEVDTNENTLFLWHEEMYVLENIPCYYSQHNERWDKSFANASYARIRRVDDGSIVTNVSATIGFGFITPFVDEDFDTLWLFGSNCNRCVHQAHGCLSERKVAVWKALDETMRRWSPAAEAEGTVATFNVQVSRVRQNISIATTTSLPPHGYVMILELAERFMVNNAKDGDLTKGWEVVKDAVNPKEKGGPSIRYSELDGFYYAILGGHTVDLFRTKDFKTWEEAPQANKPFIESSAADAQVSNIAGFDATVAVERNFRPDMEGASNYQKWDWNSNDADVCCMTKNKTSVYANSKSWVLWGAGTQGKAPKPPLTRANHCANIVATANMSLPELLAAHFKG